MATEVKKVERNWNDILKNILGAIPMKIYAELNRPEQRAAYVLPYIHILCLSSDKKKYVQGGTVIGGTILLVSNCFLLKNKA